MQKKIKTLSSYQEAAPFKKPATFSITLRARIIIYSALGAQKIDVTPFSFL